MLQACMCLSMSAHEVRKWSYLTLSNAAEYSSFVDSLDFEIAQRGLTGSEDEVLAGREPDRS